MPLHKLGCEKRWCTFCQADECQGNILKHSNTAPGGRGVHGGAKPFAELLEGDGVLCEPNIVLIE